MLQRLIDARLVVALFALGLAVRFAFVCDDAFISFRYARQLVHGHGFSYNALDAPVEGFSNLAWVVLASGFEFVGADTPLFMQLVSTAAGLVGLLVTFGLARTYGCGETATVAAGAWVGWSPAWAVWSTGGLETVPFATSVLVAFWTWVRRDSHPVVLLLTGGLVATLRVEGLAYVALFCILRGDRARWRTLVGLGVALCGWRLYTFGAWMPHTAVVKGALDGARLGRGVRYVLHAALVLGTPVLVALAALPNSRDREGRELVGVPVLAGILAVLAGGDFLPMGRLLVVALPFGALLGARLLERCAQRWGPTAAGIVAFSVVGIQLVPMAGLPLAPESWVARVHVRHTDAAVISELARWERTRDNAVGFAARGRALADDAQPWDSVVAPAVGALGYYSKLHVFDQHGLVTRDVGERPVDVGSELRSPGHDKFVPAVFFAGRRPTYLHTKIVHGRRSPRRMRDLLESWSVPLELQSAYVPDYREVIVEGRRERHFLLVVRRKRFDEDPDRLWRNFFDRTRVLASDL